MSIHVALNHVTHYRYDRPIHLGPQVVRLRPAPHSRTRILSYSMRVEPAEHFINWQQDPQSNYLARLVFPEPTTVLPRRGRPRRRDGGAQPVRLLPRAERREVSVRATSPSCWSSSRPTCCKAPATPRFVEYLVEHRRAASGRRATSWWTLNQRLQNDIAYLIRMEPGVQTPEQTLRNAQRLVPRQRLAAGAAAAPPRPRGALRLRLPDPAEERRQVARRPERHRGRLHRPARLVRGLPAGRRLDRPRPDLGPATPAKATSRSPARPSRRRRRRSAARSTRARRPSSTTCRCAASGKRRASPCRTPMRSGRAIDALGNQVDADLRRQDVRLTQGGEPTFVSVDDREGGEWNTEAMGPTKRDPERRADGAAARSKYGSGGLLHFGQGKWYPGEQLPRWSLNLYWRKDGEPSGTTRRSSPTSTTTTARPRRRPREFLARLAQRLGLDRDNVFAGLRGRLVLPLARAQAADQRRSVRFAPRRRARARRGCAACSSAA